MRDRVILHCDCNSFFASVETALNPFLAHVPMAVCGDPEQRHGIVLAKNELAKAYGIKTAQTVHEAKRLCPNLVIVPPSYEKYVEYSHRVNAIYSEYTDLIEPFGIDESWLDVTASGRLFGDGPEIAEIIRKRVEREIGITISVGVSFNKVFAKLGSDYKKPNAVTVISRDNYQRIVYPLPVEWLLYVGKKTVEILDGIGIKTIGDLSSAPIELLSYKLGKFGEMISSFAKGEDSSPVNAEREDVKSVGNGFTFKKDLLSFEEIRCGVYYLSEEIGTRLRAKGLSCSTVSVQIKDEFLRVSQKQCQLNSPTDISREIADSALKIIQASWTPSRPIRTITITASGLSHASEVATQIDFFSNESSDEERARQRRNEEAVDEIRRKFGQSAIVRGVYIDNKIGLIDPRKK